jgi:hypothetical protein
MRRLRRGALARVEVEIVTWTLCTASRLLVSWLAIPAALSATEHAMPWSDAGLSERQAASHLIDRFTFGATPGLVDQVVAQGLEEWLARQLSADSRSGDLDAKLAALATLELTNDQIVRDYPRPGRLRREAIEAGRLDPKLDGEDQRRLLRQYAQEMGYKPQRQIVGELVAQRLFRAVHSPNQVAEVMVDFWFNHLYVSATDNQCRRFIGTYERDVVRAYVFERFVEMLRASAKHPAMLLYLDNALSSAPEHVATRVTVAKAELRQQPGRAGLRYDEMFERMERNEAKRQGPCCRMASVAHASASACSDRWRQSSGSFSTGIFSSLPTATTPKRSKCSVVPCRQAAASRKGRRSSTCWGATRARRDIWHGS